MQTGIMNSSTDQLAALRAACAACEAEWDRLDAIADPAATIRARAVIGPRLWHLRAQLKRIERAHTGEQR